MPKKSAAARSGGQRNKPRVQKSIELVRQTVEEKEPSVEKEVDTRDEVEAQDRDELTPTDVSTQAQYEQFLLPYPKDRDELTPTDVSAASTSERTKNESVKIANSAAARRKASEQFATPDTQSEEASAVSSTGTTSKGTAASRLAARRQAVQKTQQRASATLITAEHYSYVRRDLIVIAILAFIMFAVIIGLHFVPAIGG